MADPAAIADADNWRGGAYELGATGNGRLERALPALWRAAGVHGCYGTREREPDDQEQVPCTVGSIDEFAWLYGLVDLPNGVRMVCSAYVIRVENGSDCLTFSLPEGAMARAGDRLAEFPPGEPDVGRSSSGAARSMIGSHGSPAKCSQRRTSTWGSSDTR